MKDSIVETPVYTSANSESRFGIEITGKAFELLSGGIYKNKIAAIVRELSANARDSHVAAGKSTVPFKIVLPNELHPYFEVEDYGVGLDDYEVRNVYTVMLKSTKLNTNFEVGSFGLGSKTPITYTSSFNIRARKNGVERTYTCYRDATGTPCINLMSEKATTEGNGLRVSVPVPASDFSRFLHEAEFILSFFEVQPIVKSANFKFLIDQEKIDEFYERDVLILNRLDGNYSELYSNHRFFIVMGGICYPIDHGTIQDCVSNHSEATDASLTYVKRMNQTMNTHMFVNFPIGAFSISEIAASRESLTLNNETRKKIGDRFNALFQELWEEDHKKINELPNIIEAGKYLHAIGALSYLFIDTYTYRGQEMRDVFEMYLMPKRGIRQYSRSQYTWKIGTDTRLSLVTAITTQYFTFIFSEKNDKRRMGLISFCNKKVNSSGNRVVYIPNTSEAAIRRYAKYMSIDNYEVISFTEYLDALKEERAERRRLNKLNNVKPVSQRAKSEDTEIYARTVQIKPNQFSDIFNAKLIDVTEDDAEFYMYDDSSKFNFYFDAPELFLGGLRHSFRSLLGNIDYEPEKKIVILKKTRLNARKIELNNIPHIDKWFQKLVDHAYERFQKLNDKVLNVVTYNVSDKTIKTLLSASNNIKTLFDNYVREDCPDISSSDDFVIKTNYSDDVVADLKMIKHFIAKDPRYADKIESNEMNLKQWTLSYGTFQSFLWDVYDTYKLLKGNFEYFKKNDCDVKEFETHMINYIKMVDELELGAEMKPTHQFNV